MARKLTGKATKNRKEVPQKNGDIYIYDREYQYNPEKKKTIRISNKLLAKIPKGMSKEVPTRPKRKSASATLAGIQSDGSTEPNIYASRQHTGLTDILSHVGSISGIDDALLASTDWSRSKKTIPSKNKNLK